MTTQPDRDVSDAEVDAAVQMLKLLADPTRLRIIWALVHGEHSVSDLANHVGAQVPTVSQHLAKLRLAQVVSVRRAGTQLFYSANSEHIERLALEAFGQVSHQVPGVAPQRSERPANRSLQA